MASSKPRNSTYHVVPHFNIAAAGGAMRLGAVVKNLEDLAPLNRKDGDFVPVPAEDIYPATQQTGFRATRGQILSGRFGAWAEAVGIGGLGGRGGAHAHAERSGEETLSCDSIVTTYFDPTEEWVGRCLASKPVHDYIVGTAYRAEVYIVTGLKVATNLSFGSSTSKSDGAGIEGQVSAPQAPVGVGVEAVRKADRSQTCEFASSDIVVGFRVHKYRYKRKGLFSRDRKAVGQNFVRGAEMLDGRAMAKSGLQFEEVPVEEETLTW